MARKNIIFITNYSKQMKQDTWYIVLLFDIAIAVWPWTHCVTIKANTLFLPRKLDLNNLHARVLILQ